MKNKKLILGLSVLLAIIIALFVTVCVFMKPDTEQGLKQISVTVVYQDKTDKEFQISTIAEFLGEALFEEELISEEEYKSGFLTYVDGKRADYTQDKAWWSITKKGEMVTVGINELALSDGDEFEITYTPV